MGGGIRKWDSAEAILAADEARWAWLGRRRFATNPVLTGNQVRLDGLLSNDAVCGDISIRTLFFVYRWGKRSVVDYRERVQAEGRV